MILQDRKGAQHSTPSPHSQWHPIEARSFISQWHERLKLGEPSRYRPGSELFSAGMEASDGFLLVGGIVKLYYMLPEDREALLMLAYPGQLIDGAIAAPGAPTSMTAVAATPCQVYRLNLQRLDKMANDDPALASLLQRTLRHELRRRTAALAEVLSLSPADRFGRILGELGNVLGHEIHQPRIPVPLKDQEMAMMLGLSGRQFKRIKKQFQEKSGAAVEAAGAFVLSNS